MKKGTFTIIILTSFVFLSGIALGSDLVEVGMSFQIRNINVENGAIPITVEASSSTNSSNPFFKGIPIKEIGPYLPSGEFDFAEYGVFLKYTLPGKSVIRPYFRLEMSQPYDASVHGIDYAGYNYKIDYEYKIPIEPEIGLSIFEEYEHSLSLGVGYQKSRLTYYKGLEPFGPGLEKLGSTTNDMVNFKVNITVFFDNIAWSMEVIYTPYWDKIGGSSIGFSLQFTF